MLPVFAVLAVLVREVVESHIGGIHCAVYPKTLTLNCEQWKACSIVSYVNILDSHVCSV